MCVTDLLTKDGSKKVTKLLHDDGILPTDVEYKSHGEVGGARLKMSESQKVNQASEETRLKMSESQVKRYAKRKQTWSDEDDCTNDRVSLGMTGQYCRMCYRKQLSTKLFASVKVKRCKTSAMGCARCQEPICKECWAEGYDKHK